MTTPDDRISTITALSHEFGTEDYVRGGGGNTSCKNESTLWVKPSGTTLKDISEDDFLAMERAKIGALFTAEAPEDPQAREAFVTETMMAARCEGEDGRPSVEAPLHDAFDATYVVHTHPALVGGMVCAVEGEAACRRLFPDALWVPFVDPGYMLSKTVKDAMDAYKNAHGHQPGLVFLQNHGVFVAGDTPEAIRELYGRVMSTLSKAYQEAEVATQLPPPATPPPRPEEAHAVLEVLHHNLGLEHMASGTGTASFAVAEGPLSPDHIVYSRSFPLIGTPTAESLADFRERYGYPPRVIVAPEGVYAIGPSEKAAKLALEFAMDGALVKQLAAAFGGVRYMDDRARLFIENWEAESYRQGVSGAK